MTEFESVTLNWTVALEPGDFFLAEDDDIYRVPAVYICETVYPTRHVVYVGRTREFLTRLRDHIVATLGLTYWLRDENGSFAFEPKAGAAFVADLRRMEDLQAMAADSIRRMRWLFAEAETTALPFLEGILIRHVKQMERGGLTIDGLPIESDNCNLGTAPTAPVEVRNDGASRAVELLGEKIAWPMEAAA